jgi:sulfonate transport system permease protein
VHGSSHPGPERPRRAPGNLPRRIRALARRGSAFAVILAAWWIASAAGWVNPFLLPSPATVLHAAAGLAADGTLLTNTLVSVTRVGIGFALAVAAAIPAAILFALLPGLRDIAEPPLEFLRQTPPLALIPLLILWLGIGEAQKLGIIVLACFFPIFLGTLGGLAQVDPRLIEVGRVCGLSRAAIVWRIVLPAAAAPIVIGLRIGLGYSWRALVGAELVAASSGLGYLIVDAENLARTDIVIVGIIVIGTLGLLADLAMRALTRRLLPWVRPGAETIGA